MKTYTNPSKTLWTTLVERPSVKEAELFSLVKEIFDAVKIEGDAAVQRYSLQFDKVSTTNLLVPKSSIELAGATLSTELRDAIQLAKHNIELFHTSQQEQKKVIETTTGVRCWRESRAIEQVGIYIPGGSAPLFSTVLMLGIPAQLAGCKEIVLCSPPDSQGNIHPAILYAAQLVGITTIAAVGGIQAIAAMSYGTSAIPKVAKIFGPGNQFVTAAKQYAQQEGIAIDMPAGPSEILVIADSNCPPEFVAADLLSQAEHGEDSQVILLSDQETVVSAVLAAIKEQITALPRKTIAEKALNNSKAIVFNSIRECLDFSNLYAPEHLLLAVENAEDYIPAISNAGSVFLGNYSCESAGDYLTGPNHTLPTNGYARSYSGVSLDSFVKKITFQEVSPAGLQIIGKSIEVMAAAEQLIAHKNAVSIRLNTL